MSAIDEFTSLLETTEVMRQALRSLKEEPAVLLSAICRDYRVSGQPVPDHRLPLAGYMGEAALKALLSAGLVEQHPGGRISLYSYEPTEKGLQQYQKLEAEGFYRR